MKPRSRCRNRLDCGSRLDSFLLPVAENAWQMGEFGHPIGDADAHQRLVQRDLPRRRRQDVLTAEHVGDLHHRVVDRIDQRVQRIPAAAGDREVGNGACGERRRPAHQVGPAEVLVGHPQTEHGLAAFGCELGTLQRRSGCGRSCRSPAWGYGRPRRVAPRPPLPSSTPRRPHLRRSAGTPRRGRSRRARIAGTARTARRSPVPRPSPCPANAARPGWRRSSRRCRARRRCPRCGTRRLRRCAGRRPS